jgi:glucosamine--fructose-6-phosphate aminotransferase (isomerizing)
MCGILGVVVSVPSDKVKANLQKIYLSQKHRGVIGCGMAKLTAKNLLLRKRDVHADKMFQENFDNFFKNINQGDRLILHHRIASHGGSGQVLESNHPFVDEAFNTALIHNGIINNYDTLYRELKKKHTFESELRLVTKNNMVIQQQITDSEVILHLLDNNPIAQAMNLQKVTGSCAIAVLNKNTKGILLYRWSNPLVISHDEDFNFYFSSEFDEKLGLTKFKELDEGVLYRLTEKGFEVLKTIHEPKPIVVISKKQEKTDQTTIGNYTFNAKTGIWEDNKKTNNYKWWEDNDY